MSNHDYRTDIKIQHQFHVNIFSFEYINNYIMSAVIDWALDGYVELNPIILNKKVKQTEECIIADSEWVVCVACHHKFDRTVCDHKICKHIRKEKTDFKK
jgi:hypothetical protein